MSAQITAPTPDEIRAWPATVKAVPDAAAAFGIGSEAAYRLIREGKFPVPVLTLGRAFRVTRASVMSALGIPEVFPTAPSNPLANGTNAQVQRLASDARSEARAA